MTKIVSLAILWHTHFLSFANTPPDISFGKIDASSLKMTHYPLDSTASAVVLGDYGRSYFIYNQASGLQVVFTRHTRIKILDSEGYNWSDVYVNLYHQGSTKETVSKIKGYTYNLKNGKVVKSKLKSNGKFREKYSDNIDRVKFTLPNVKEGSIIEYTYQISSDFLSQLRDWEFQTSIPTVWSEYKVEIPEYFHYKQLMSGYHPLAVSERTASSGSFTFNYKERSGQSVTQTTMGQNTMHFQQHVHRWAAQDVPALTEEPYITTMTDYTAQIAFELASVNIPGQVHEDYSNTWETIDKELLESENFGRILDRDQAVQKPVAAVIADISSPKEKMVQIFNYVRDRVKWNEHQTFVASQSLKNTLSEKNGNTADVNLLLIAMLREAGIKAHPVALSTRDHGMLRQSFPRIDQFNYVIAQAQLDGTTYLLDATDATCPYDLLPLRCLNGQGRVIGASAGNRWVTLQSPKRSAHMVVATLTLREDGMHGQISSSRSKYDALRLRKKIATYSSPENYIAEVKQSQSAIQKYAVASVDALEDVVKETMEVTLTDGVQQAGNLIYLDPFVADEAKENPFKAEVRTYPVDYAYPSSEIYMLNLTIPEGYVVDELPENLSIALPDRGGRYVFATQVRGNVLQVSSKLDIEKVRFYAQDYAYLRQFYQQLVAKQREQIVLVKQ